jgi:hypothetical protein
MKVELGSTNVSVSADERVLVSKVVDVKMIFCDVICDVTNHSRVNTHAHILLLKLNNISTTFTWKTSVTTPDINLLNSV